MTKGLAFPTGNGCTEKTGIGCCELRLSTTTPQPGAYIEDGEIIIHIPVANLPAIVEGTWVSGVMLNRYEVTDSASFAEDLVTELNREKEDGTTRIHLMFDSAIEEAIEQGAQGIEPVEEDETGWDGWGEGE